MSYNRFLELLLRKKSGELSKAELHELDGFLKDHTRYTELTEIVDQIYETPLTEVKEIDDTYLRSRWESLRKRTGIAPTVKKSKIRFLVAATAVAAMILICLSIFFLNTKKEILPANVVVSSKIGSKTNMKLPDGSSIWLNAGSKVVYNENFGKTNRDIQLIGEAYFDVVHDTERPFIVHAKDFDIKVVGTAFNVKSFAGEESSEATLLRGSIELSLKDDLSRKIMLKPSEKLIFKKSGITKTLASSSVKSPVQVKPEILITGLEIPFNDSLTVETQWLHNNLAFRDTKLKDIATLISRWYGVTVDIKNEKLAEKEFSGIFKDESVEQVMYALKTTGNFQYTISNNHVSIFP